MKPLQRCCSREPPAYLWLEKRRTTLLQPVQVKQSQEIARIQDSHVGGSFRANLAAASSSGISSAMEQAKEAQSMADNLVYHGSRSEF